MAAAQLAIRASTAAALAFVAARYLALPYAQFAIIAAVIVTDVSATETRKLALPRIAGIFIGCALGAAMNAWLPVGAWTMALGIVAAMLCTVLLRVPGAAKLSGYVCAILLLNDLEQPWTEAFLRLVETLLGIGAAVLVSLVPKLISLETGTRDVSGIPP